MAVRDSKRRQEEQLIRSDTALLRTFANNCGISVIAVDDGGDEIYLSDTTLRYKVIHSLTPILANVYQGNEIEREILYLYLKFIGYDDVGANTIIDQDEYHSRFISAFCRIVLEYNIYTIIRVTPENVDPEFYFAMDVINHVVTTEIIDTLPATYFFALRDSNYWVPPRIQSRPTQSLNVAELEDLMSSMTVRKRDTDDEDHRSARKRK